MNSSRLRQDKNELDFKGFRGKASFKSILVTETCFLKLLRIKTVLRKSAQKTSKSHYSGNFYGTSRRYLATTVIGEYLGLVSCDAFY